MTMMHLSLLRPHAPPVGDEMVIFTTYIESQCCMNISLALYDLVSTA